MAIMLNGCFPAGSGDSGSRTTSVCGCECCEVEEDDDEDDEEDTDYTETCSGYASYKGYSGGTCRSSCPEGYVDIGTTDDCGAICCGKESDTGRDQDSRGQPT